MSLNNSLIAKDHEDWRHFTAKALRNKTFMVGAVLTILILAIAVLSYFWTPFDTTKLIIADRMQKPNNIHWLGTDHFGRDIFSMIMVGARNSIAVALLAVGIGIVIGVPLGCWAAAKRGLIDEFFMRSSDIIFAFPSLLSAVMITAIFGPSATNAIIAIGIFNIPVFARVARGAALAIWPREFILAARAAGKNSAQITWQHILPNIANLLIVQGTIQFSLGILAEAGLSYVGLGTQPPDVSWGRMLNEAQTMIAIAPHMAIIPGLTIIITVLGLNLLGDGFRDLLDPKLRRDRS